MIPAAFAVKISNDLRSGFGVSDPEFRFILQRRHNILQNPIQLVFIYRKYQRKIDFPVFQKRSHVFGE